MPAFRRVDLDSGGRFNLLKAQPMAGYARIAGILPLFFSAPFQSANVGQDAHK
jgi:hypothetical protein